MSLHSTEVLGYAAACLVLATFSVRSITTLRALAIASNLMFIAYASFAQLVPVLVLHALLLPLNVWRLCETSAAAVNRKPHPAWRRSTIRLPRHGPCPRHGSARSLAGMPSRRIKQRASHAN